MHMFRNMSESDEDAVDSKQARIWREQISRLTASATPALDLSRALVQKHMIGSKDKVASDMG